MPAVVEQTWVKVAQSEDFIEHSGGCVEVDGTQIAIFNFNEKTEWYAVQNNCPHEDRMILSRGLTGDLENDYKVACPLHKNSFSLKTGKNLGNSCQHLKTYPVKCENGDVFIALE